MVGWVTLTNDVVVCWGVCTNDDVLWSDAQCWFCVTLWPYGENMRHVVWHVSPWKTNKTLSAALPLNYEEDLTLWQSFSVG